MDQRAEYLIQILEHIGSPLMKSVLDVSASAEGGDVHDAQKIAELLGKTVQLSIDMANISDLENVQSDSVRVALAAISGNLVGEIYRRNRQTPGDNDLKRVTSALQAVLTFSENFTPDKENIERLKTLRATGTAPIDPLQVNVQYLYAFIPAINAIGAYAFGQPEQKIIMDVASRLTIRAENLRRTLMGDADGERAKLVDLAILKTLIGLYAACHTRETEKLAQMSDEQRSQQNLSLDNVWKAFDLRLAMLEALAGGLLPGAASLAAQGGTSGGQAPQPAAPPATTASPPPAPPPVAESSAAQPAKPAIFSAPKAPAETPPPAQPEAPPQQEQAVTAPTQQDVPPPSAPQASANPMAMFAKKPAAEETPTATAPQPAAAQPAEPPAATAPPQPAAQEQPAQTQQGAASPMSFFKAPPKKDDE